jgi:hypothetical protein
MFYFLVFLLFGVFHFSVFFGRVDKGATIKAAKAKAAFSEYFKFSLNFGMACEQQVVYEKRDFVEKIEDFLFVVKFCGRE